ncbi:MAG: Restriction endonuclease subunit [Pseudomonadota bacterium]|nr:Restriction endonuclease subunit [Pseudomonadota bacterium]
MIDITPYQFDIVVSILKKHVPHCEVRVFGSRYKWTSKSYSDLDLAIVGTKKLDKKVIYDLKEAFSESDLPIRVDVLDWHAISEEFRQIIEQGYEVIQTKQLPDGWEVRKLGEVCCSVSDTYKLSGKTTVIFLNTSDILDGEFLHKVYIDVISLPGQAKKSIHFNDILYSEIRPKNKRYAFVNFQNTTDYIVSTKLMVLRANCDMVNPRYLYLMLTSNEKCAEFQFIAESRSGTFPRITFDAISKSTFYIPPLTIQKNIVSILSSLDEKIDINKQINNKLEEIAQALFKQWFIDFNFPNENGMPYKDSGGAMIDSELGRIPIGWQIGMIGDYVKIKSGFAFKSQWWTTTGVKVIKIKDISNNTISSNELSHISIDNAKKASDFSVKAGDLLIAMTGATVGKIGLVPETEFKLLVNQRVGKFFLGDKPIEKVGFLYMNLLQDNVAYQINARANGSAQANISPTDIESIKIVLPPKQIINIFNLTVTPIFEYICRNINQNNKLQQVRDSLLPKLMSGKVDVTHGV